MATRAFLIFVLLCGITGCGPVMKLVFRSAARTAVKTAVIASSADTEEDDMSMEEFQAALAEAIEEVYVEPGEALTFEQFSQFSNNGQACVLFVRAPLSKVARIYAELADVQLEMSSKLTNEYGVADSAVVAMKDSEWTTILHSLGSTMWFDQTAELAKRLNTRVFEYESDEVTSIYSVRPDGTKLRFMTEEDLEWSRELAEDEGDEPPKAKVIDSYSNMLAHYKIKPPVFTYTEEGTLVLMPGEEDRIKRVRAVAP